MAANEPEFGEALGWAPGADDEEGVVGLGDFGMMFPPEDGADKLEPVDDELLGDPPSADFLESDGICPLVTLR